MKTNSMVSIIMPSYNATMFIQEAIDSVLKQTYCNWELIIVDDGSKDDTVGLITQYLNEDSRIRLIQLQKNSGAAVARNTAIENANGRYIAFLDSDDKWISKKLEIQIAYMIKNNIAFSYAQYKKINHKSEVISNTIIAPLHVTYDMLLKTCYIPCLTAIYDTGILGKQFMPLIEKRQDYGLWLKITKNVDAFGVDQCLAHYRVHQNTISSNKVKAAFYHWRILREYENVNLIKASYYFIYYAISGLKKYLK